MSRLPLVFSLLKSFTWLFGMVTLGVSAAFQNRGTISGSWRFFDYDPARAVTAFGAITVAYLTVFALCQFFLGNCVVTSVMVDTIAFGSLVVIGLGSVGSLSMYDSVLSSCFPQSVCQLGTATLGLDWILELLILGILLGEVIHTLEHYGRSKATWMTSFNSLLRDAKPMVKIIPLEEGLILRRGTADSGSTVVTNRPNELVSPRNTAPYQNLK